MLSTDVKSMTPSLHAPMGLPSGSLGVLIELLPAAPTKRAPSPAPCEIEARDLASNAAVSFMWGRCAIVNLIKAWVTDAQLYNLGMNAVMKRRKGER